MSLKNLIKSEAKEKEVVIELLHEDSIMPKYAHEKDAGADIFAYIKPKEEITLEPLERIVIGTGIKINIPEDYEIQVRAKSGLASKQGLVIANGIGTIDEQYTGEIGVIAINLSREPITIKHGQKIAQIVLSPIIKVPFREGVVIKETTRGDKGYGSTGI